MKPLKFVIGSALVVLAGLLLQSCGSITELTPSPPPPSPTYPPTYTPIPQPTVTPSPTPTPDLRYFTEEFNDDIPNWQLFVMKGFEPGLTFQSGDGNVHFEINDRNLWVYLIYNAAAYTDVRIDAATDNFGVNNNQVKLICRYSEEYGWYEVNISNNGLFNFTFFDQVSQRYLPMYDGGTRAIHTGRSVNEYTLICKDNQLTLYINGEDIYTLTDRVYNLREGKIGVSVASVRDLPVIVEFDRISVSKP